jgi:hypothetical protein
MNIIEESSFLLNQLNQTIQETKEICHSLSLSMRPRNFMNLKLKEKSMNSIHDALIQSASGRKLVVKINEEMRAKAITREQAREKSRKMRMEHFIRRERVQSLKDLVHYTFVEYPNKMKYRNRFDVYKISKERVREIGIEGGKEYDRVVRTLQFAPTSKKAYQEAVALFTDCQHSFNDYDSSDTIIRHSRAA